MTAPTNSIGDIAEVTQHNSDRENQAGHAEEGWLHTGSIGALDLDGYPRITDRKKDMIVLSGGDNGAPARVEGMLIVEPEIAQAVVLGDGKPAISALLVAAFPQANGLLTPTLKVRGGR